MHFSRLMSVDPDQVKRKTAENFYLWLDEAYTESKRIVK